MPQLNIGVIGIGHWGKNYIRLLNEHPEVKNTHIYDISEKSIKNVMKKYSKVLPYKRLNEFFKTSSIDAIIIATPATTHYSLGVLGLKNRKHLLIEKPLCTTVKEGEKLLELAEKNKCIVMVGHTFLYNNSVIKMKNIIKKKTFGKILYITARRTHLGLIRPDVSVHWDLALHDISIINYLLDKTPQEVDCDAVKIYYKGVTFLKDQKYEGFGEFKYLVRDGKIESPKIKMVEPLKNQVDDFLYSILKNRQPAVTGKDGLEVVKVLEKIDRAIKLKSKRKN